MQISDIKISDGDKLSMDKVSIEELQNYWDNNLHDHGDEVTNEPEGSANFYRDLENYHYYKLNYLPRVLDFSSYKGKKVLDVGCGIGIDLINFAKEGALVTGIDISEKNVKLAAENLRLNGLNGEFVTMNGERMKFKNDVFDMVFAIGVITYTPDPKQMISEIYRVLRPGGRAILMMYHRNSWLFYFTKLINTKLEREDAPFYLTCSIDEFREMLRDFSSFEIVVERFPVATRIHKGFLANIYNYIFVPAFKLIPRKFIKRFGAHLIAISVK